MGTTTMTPVTTTTPMKATALTPVTATMAMEEEAAVDEGAGAVVGVEDEEAEAADGDDDFCKNTTRENCTRYALDTYYYTLLPRLGFRFSTLCCVLRQVEVQHSK